MPHPGRHEGLPSLLVAPGQELLGVEWSGLCRGAGSFGAVVRGTMLHARCHTIEALGGREVVLQRLLANPGYEPRRLLRTAVAIKVGAWLA
jgi:hypothetical protein